MQQARRIPIRTPKDLGPVADKLSTMFDTDILVVVGSQALLVGWPNSPDEIRRSAEIDAYPANWEMWQAAMDRVAPPGTPPAEVSEEINALAGDGSTFQDQWGFYIDGVNGQTSPLPTGWQERAVFKEIKNRHGAFVTIVAPCPDDIIVSKAMRLADKDISFIELYHKFRPLDPDLMAQRIAAVPNIHPEICARAEKFFRALPPSDAKKQPDPWKNVQRFIPEYPRDTHCAFYHPADNTVIIRKWDPDLKLYAKVDNPLGPAVCGKAIQKHFMEGRQMEPDAWQEHPVVQKARSGEAVGEPPPWKQAM
jgi:hypothetical protein